MDKTIEGLQITLKTLKNDIEQRDNLIRVNLLQIKNEVIETWRFAFQNHGFVVAEPSQDDELNSSLTQALNATSDGSESTYEFIFIFYNKLFFATLAVVSGSILRIIFNPPPSKHPF